MVDIRGSVSVCGIRLVCLRPFVASGAALIIAFELPLSPTRRYFVLLEILTTVFFANLVIAVSYRSYKEYASNKLISRLQKRQASLRKAFTLLLSTKPGRRKDSQEGPGSPLSSPPFSPNVAKSNGSDDDDGLGTLGMGAGTGLGMGMGITATRREADAAFEDNFFRNGQVDKTTEDSTSSTESEDSEDSLSLEQWLLLFLFERSKKKLARVVGTEIFTSVGQQFVNHSLCVWLPQPLTNVCLCCRC